MNDGRLKRRNINFSSRFTKCNRAFPAISNIEQRTLGTVHYHQRACLIAVGTLTHATLHETISLGQGCRFAMVRPQHTRRSFRAFSRAQGLVTLTFPEVPPPGDLHTRLGLYFGAREPLTLSGVLFLPNSSRMRSALKSISSGIKGPALLWVITMLYFSLFKA